MIVCKIPQMVANDTNSRPVSLNNWIPYITGKVTFIMTKHHFVEVVKYISLSVSPMASPASLGYTQQTWYYKVVFYVGS